MSYCQRKLTKSPICNPVKVGSKSLDHALLDVMKIDVDFAKTEFNNNLIIHIQDFLSCSIFILLTLFYKILLFLSNMLALRALIL